MGGDPPDLGIAPRFRQAETGCHPELSDADQCPVADGGGGHGRAGDRVGAQQPGDAGGRAELEPASLALLSPRAWLGRDDQRGLVVLSRKPSAAKLGHPELRDLARRCRRQARSEEHTSELQSLMRIPYSDFGLKKKKYTST